MKFQPDEMLRILDRHFNGGVVDPLLLGNRDQWMAVYTHASTAGEHEGSNAATGRVSRTSVEEAAEEIAKNARRIQKMIAACIQDMELQQPFALSDEAKDEQLAGRHLFGSDDVSVGDGLSKPLRYELDARRNRNMITSHAADEQRGQQGGATCARSRQDGGGPSCSLRHAYGQAVLRRHFVQGRSFAQEHHRCPGH